MKLYLLTRRNGDNKPVYDCNDGFVVRAVNEDCARMCANALACDEGYIWNDITQTTCEELTINGPEEVVLADFHAG